MTHPTTATNSRVGQIRMGGVCPTAELTPREIRRLAFDVAANVDPPIVSKTNQASIWLPHGGAEQQPRPSITIHCGSVSVAKVLFKDPQNVAPATSYLGGTDLGLETQGYRKKCLQHKFVSKSRERLHWWKLSRRCNYWSHRI